MKKLLLGAFALSISTSVFAQKSQNAEEDAFSKEMSQVLSEIKSCQRPAILEDNLSTSGQRKLLMKSGTVIVTKSALGDPSIEDRAYYFRLAESAGMKIQNAKGQQIQLIDKSKLEKILHIYEKTQKLDSDVFVSDAELSKRGSVSVLMEMVHKIRLGDVEFSDDITGEALEVTIPVNLITLKHKIQNNLQLSLDELRKDGKDDDSMNTHMGDMAPLIFASALDQVPDFFKRSIDTHFVQLFDQCKK